MVNEALLWVLAERLYGPVERAVYAPLCIVVSSMHVFYGEKNVFHCDGLSRLIPRRLLALENDVHMFQRPGDSFSCTAVIVSGNENGEPLVPT